MTGRERIAYDGGISLWRQSRHLRDGLYSRDIRAWPRTLWGFVLRGMRVAAARDNPRPVWLTESRGLVFLTMPRDDQP